MHKRIHEIWLSLCCTPGTPTFANLKDAFKTPADIYTSTEKEIRRAVGPNCSDCARLFSRDLTRAEQIYDYCVKKEINIVSYYDKEYPENLRTIPTPPVLLYYRGSLPDFARHFVCAVVGTRSLTEYGRVNTFRIAQELAQAGAIVVSGMAIGIDGVAHAAALSAGGETVAVLGCGIDVCYPEVHQTLARAIVKSGCVMTEYPPGTRPDRYNFPTRNRLISGLAHATVMMEGSEKSGALITARHAKKQGRLVFAFPGNVTSKGSEATNLLIKNGAHMIENSSDIFDMIDNPYLWPALKTENVDFNRPLNMMETLRKYSVGCVTPTEDFYYIPKGQRPKPAFAKERPKPKEEDKIEKLEPLLSVGEVVLDAKDAVPENLKEEPETKNDNVFDRDMMRVYKKIPVTGSCKIDSLVDEQTDYRQVMITLVKLRVLSLVKILPGDNVARMIVT